MDYLVYGYYILLLVLLFWGVRFFGRNKWNDEFLSLTQMKALQGFCAVCIMLHHLGQKTCAPWLERMYIVHGLDVFVPIGYLFVSVFLFCSGYGLYISVKKKPNYLDHFLSRRVLLVVLSFYSTGLIFLVARFLVGKRMDLSHFIYFVTGIQLSNPNAWFVIALPIFYVGFYLAFKYCKKENNAIYLTCLVVFIYTLIGTFTDHNDWWMRGEWWYNSVHLFSVGLLFAKFKDTIVAKVKKHYVIVLVLTLIGFVAFYEISGIAQNVVSYYGEDYNHSFKVLRRWICLFTQMGASCGFVFSIFLIGMKVKIGNKALAFFGSLTLELYLIHGLFVELFGYSFLDMAPSIYYIRNVALFVAVVFILSIPSAIGLQKFHKFVVNQVTKRQTKEVKQ